MGDTKIPEIIEVPAEIRYWKMIGKRFCLLLPRPKLRYGYPTAKNSDKTVMSIDVFKGFDEGADLAARISIAEHDMGEDGLRSGFKDLKIEVFDRNLCEDLLLQFEAWYVRTGKHVRIILRYPWIDQMPTRYELGRIDVVTGSR